MGYSNQDLLLGQPSFLTLFHPDDADISQAIFSSSEQIKPIGLTFRIIDVNGQCVIVSACYNKKIDSVNNQTVIQVEIQPSNNLDINIVERASLSNFVAMLENTNDFIYFKDRSHMFTGASQTLVAHTDPSEHWTDLIGKTDYELMSSTWADIYYTLEKKVFNGEVEVAREIQPTINNQGEQGWIDNRKYPIKDTGGNVIGLFGVGRDITELKQAQDALKAEKDFADKIIETAQAIILVLNQYGGIVRFNSYTESLLGDSLVAVKGKNWIKRYVPEDEQKHIETLLDDSLKNKKSKISESVVCKIIARDGKKYHIEWHDHTIKDDNNNCIGLIAVGIDITDRIVREEQLEKIAHFDPLTNLPNRALLSDRLSQAMSRCQRHNRSIAVLFLDLDGFKEVNDKHGHSIGDQLLIELAQRMSLVMRDEDTLSRLGGDEFVAVLTDLDNIEASELILGRLLEAVSQPVVIGGMTLKVSVSIGVTIYPQDPADSTDMLMRHADQAMYIAKQNGKNRYHFFDLSQANTIKSQMEHITAIRKGLKNQEFVLHYQPKVNMRTGVVIGVEALIRWQHPEQGLLTPYAFLPATENHAVGVEIGNWVLDAAMRQLDLWQRMGINLPISVSVNIAAVHLQDNYFIDQLKAILDAYPEVDPGKLELEILETSALENVQNISAIMDTCIAFGVKFAIDDFGTGYSSLTYLRRLPAHLIKIDQSFVKDMLDDPGDLAIVGAVISLAKAFKRNVIAEGVETIEHGTKLLELGCELAQGYGIAKPMMAADIPEWIDEWTPDDNWQK